MKVPFSFCSLIKSIEDLSDSAPVTAIKRQFQSLTQVLTVSRLTQSTSANYVANVKMSANSPPLIRVMIAAQLKSLDHLRMDLMLFLPSLCLA